MGLNRRFFSTVQAEITLIFANSVYFAFINHPLISWTERDGKQPSLPFSLLPGVQIIEKTVESASLLNAIEQTYASLCSPSR